MTSHHAESGPNNSLAAGWIKPGGDAASTPARPGPDRRHIPEVDSPPVGRLTENIDGLVSALNAIRPLEPQVERGAELMADALSGGNKLLACGNGGSATDAAHLTAEFVCRFERDRGAYPAICLATAPGDITAIANDYTFERVFERQVEAFGQAGDVLVCLSTSGNSENVRLAIIAGVERGMTTIALLGRDGGACLGLADLELLVPGQQTARIQEAHKLLIHTMCELADARLS